MRYQLLEFMVRLAIDKYFRSTASYMESIDRIFESDGVVAFLS